MDVLRTPPEKEPAAETLGSVRPADTDAASPGYDPPVRIVLLVAMFVLWESSASLGDQWTQFDPSAGAIVLAAGYLLMLAAMLVWAKRWVAGLGGRGPAAPAGRFHSAVSACRYLVPLWFAVGVYYLGWHDWVDRLLGRAAAFSSVSTLVGVAPGFLAWAGLWWPQHVVDVAERVLDVEYDLDAGLPVFAPPTLTQYVAHRFRTQILFTTVPIALAMIVRDLFAAAWTTVSRTGWGVAHLPSAHPDAVSSVVSVVTVLGVVVVAPPILIHVLSTTPLEPSPLRDRLLRMSEVAGLRCRDVLIWHTHHNLGNAMVMGLLPRVRYVLLTDLLLESMTDLQIEAVFAHELGHVRHRHLFWNFAFLICFGGLACAIGDRLDFLGQTAEVISALGGVAVILICFGYLLRWFERQADVYAGGFGDVGAAVFASALERVAVVNGIPVEAPNWTHGSIAARAAFVRRWAGDAAVAARHARQSRRVRFALVVGLTLCGLAAAWLSAE